MAIQLPMLIVFLFRALAGAHSSSRRDDVARQLLKLLNDFLPFGQGVIALGRSESELDLEFLAQGGDASIWQHVASNGPFSSTEQAAVPVYVNGALCGVISVESNSVDALATLTAVSSLASVAIESVREVEELRREYVELERKLLQRNSGGILGQSPAVLKLLDRIERLAPRDTTVLILGESGTGKELVAKLLHAASPRSAAPFAAINCAAIAGDLLESELFGYEKGAFTGAVAVKRGKLEAADGGTLFLDEIGELAVPLQAKLLRVLQEREFERLGSTRSLKVDIRVVTATNRDLAEEARVENFRQDLYHRLNVVSLRTLPLRERVMDNPLLAQHFLGVFSARTNRKRLSLSMDTLRCLDAYHWPGNVRELENAIEHAVVLAEGPLILPGDLPEHLWTSPSPAAAGVFQDSVADAKRDSILRAYEQSKGDYKGAAKILRLRPNYLLTTKKPDGLILDLSEIEEVDSSGLGELVILYTTSGQHGSRICLLNPSERVARVIAATRLTEILPQFEGRDAALQGGLSKG